MGPGTHQQVTVFVFEGLSLINEIDGETESFFFFKEMEQSAFSVFFF